MKTQNLEAEVEKILRECERDLKALCLINETGASPEDEHFGTPVFRYIWLKLTKILRNNKIETPASIFEALDDLCNVPTEELQNRQGEHNER